MSELEDSLAQQIHWARLPEPERQARFVPGRRLTWDFFWRDHQVALEVQGGTWNAGKHGRGSGIAKDQEKLFQAVLAGVHVLQVSPQHVRDGTALRWVQAALAAHPART